MNALTEWIDGLNIEYPGESASFELGNVSVTVRIEQDDMSGFDFINDCDCYGKVAWADDRRRGDGRNPRPPGFTGAARKLWTCYRPAPPGRWACYWWEPYREGRKVYDSPEDMRAVRDLLECGPVIVVVESTVHHEAGVCPCCGHAESRDVSSYDALGGIDSVANGYLAVVVRDLLPADLFT